ncbi:MAG: transketolase [Deltaproteobacteria bacterium]|nr:transketolase [Deltaproteobacteria bacterium]
MQTQSSKPENISSQKLINDDATAKRLRAVILKMIHAGKSGHPGGSFSCLEIIMTLFGDILRFDAKNPEWDERDRFILSKGHGVPALYAVLAECGFFPKDWLLTLRQLGSPLQGHPDRLRIPATEAATGSLGQGLSIAQGMAMAGKMDKKDFRVYCVMGDGEIQEGQVWEAAMSAPKFKLDNLTAIIDFNHGQIDGTSDEVMSLDPLADKWKAFNWNVVEVQGHDRKELRKILPTRVSGKPTLVIAHTIKGKGISFMEKIIDWHGVAPNDEQLAKALKELES